MGEEVLTVEAADSPLQEPILLPDLPRTEDVARVTPAMALMYEAMLDVEYGRHEEAIPKLEWVIESDPSLQGAWTALGWAYWASGREDDARKLSEQFLNLAPDAPRALNFRAQMATQDDDLDLAEELYRKSLAIHPEPYATQFAFARVLLWNGKREESLERLRVLHREDPDRLDVELQLARALVVNEEYEQALEHWNRINELVPGITDYMIARARVQVLVGALEEAREEAEAILEIESDHLVALNVLTEIAMRAQDYRQVIEAMHRVREQTETREARALIVRRMAQFMRYEQARDPDTFTVAECLRAAKEAYDLDPEDINGHLFYGEMLVLDKRYTAAAERFLDILENRNPHNQRARQGLFETYMGRRLLDEAEAQLEDNLADFNPHDPYRHHARAQLLFARGRYFDALESLEQLEREGAEGAVLTLLYHGLSPSEWTAMPSVRQFRDHLMTLRREGYRFLNVEDLPEYFEGKEPVESPDPVSWFFRLVQRAKHAVTGADGPPAIQLREVVPERVACVTFDDGLRSSFRWATPVGEELGIPLSMFILPAFIQKRDQQIVTFDDLRAYHETGVWTIGSHLMDAHYYNMPIREDGLRGNPLPNLLWFEDRDRRETLREYYRRVRREFGESKTVLLRELDLPPEGLRTMSYPLGDVGQNTDCNVEEFNVPRMLLNEAAVQYRLGFTQSSRAHAMKRDHNLLLNRWEPRRHHSGQDVLRHALRNHPVFLARRTRAEMAALQGEMDIALDALELLKRDGYPEEDLAELSAYIHRRLARLTALPAGLLDETDERAVRAVDLRRPYLGVEGESRKANVMIDEWHAALKAGLQINPRLSIEGRVGVGRIRQEVVTNTWVEVSQTTVTRSRSQTTSTRDGQTTQSEESRDSFVTRARGTNVVETFRYRAGEEMAGLTLRYIFPNGSVGGLDMRGRTFDGDLEGESVVTAAADYTWRPTLAMDLALRYERDMVPSARRVVTYDGAVFGAIWRARDWWHANGNAAYWVMSDDNSLLRLQLENFLRLSARHDVWLGLHHSMLTTDLDSDLYWTPYWDQRHLLILRLRRSYPGYYGMVRANIGLQKARGRSERWERYRARRAVGEAQGWYAGDPPDEDWKGVVGIGASGRRRWASGWELQGNVSVNAIGDHTERNLSGSLLYRF